MVKKGRRWTQSSVALASVRALLVLFSLTGCSPKIQSNFSNGETQVLSGVIYPLVALFAQNDRGNSTVPSIARRAFASDCDYSQVTVGIYSLDSNGNLSAEPLLTTGLLDAQARFRFEDISTLQSNASDSSVQYLIRATGCSGGEIRAPITSWGEVEITAAHALIGALSQGTTSQKALLKERSPEQIETLLRKLSQAISRSSRMSDAFNVLSANTTLKTQFEETFGREISVDDLQQVEPQIVYQTWPTRPLSEDTQSTFFVGASHWNPNYTIRYLWKLDGNVVSRSSTFNYLPDKNAQGTHIVALYVGSDNGSGGIDTHYPYFYQSKYVTVENTFRPVAPSIRLAGNAAVTSSPTVSIAINTGGMLSNCSTLSELAITDDSTRVPVASEFTLGCTTSGTQTVSYTLLDASDGMHTLRLWARDASGALSQTPSEYSFFLDQSPPSVVISQSPAALTSQTTAQFTFVGNDPGGGTISSYDCKLDSGAYTACSSPYSLSGLSAGTHTVSIRAIDSVGNVGNPTATSWIIDLTPPTASWVSTPLALTASSSASFEFQASDSGGGTVSGYQCSLDGAAFASCTSPKNLTSLAPGSHAFSIRALDSAGNSSVSQSYSWAIDQTGPTTTFSQTPPALTYLGSGQFSFSATDTGGGTVASYDCKLDSGSYASCSSPFAFSSLTDQTHQFWVRATDSLGNVGVAASYTWQVDSQSTLISLNTKPSAITNQTSSSLTFTASAASGAAGFQCRLDSGSYSTCTSPYAVSGLTAGNHTFDVRPLDASNNPGTAVSYSWLVDTTAPTLTVSNSPTALTAASTASFSFSATDSGGGSIDRYECKLDSGSYATCSSPHNLAALSAGSHTVLIRAFDTASNVSSTQSISWTIDQTAPVTTLTSAPNSLVNSSSATVSFSAIDSGGGSVQSYECSLDSGSFSSCTSPLSLSSLTAGSHLVTVRAIDSVGNVGTGVGTSWTIDQTAPVVTITGAPASFSNSLSASFTFSGSDTGGGAIASFECSMDGAAYAACTSPKSYSSLATGAHSISIRATDTAGNAGAAATSNWTIDTSAPSVSVLTGPSGVVNSNSATITFSGTDTGGSSISAYECKLDSNSYSACSSPLSLANLSDGAHQLQIRAIDGAGNTGSAVSRNWTVDTTASVLAVSAPAIGVRGGQLVNVTWTVTEPNPDSSRLFYIDFYDGSNWTEIGTKVSLATPYSNTSLTASSLTIPTGDTVSAKFRVRYTDLAGNIASAQSSAFRLDSTSPTISSFQLAGGSTTTALPIVTVSLAGTDPTVASATSGVSEMQLSEATTPADADWVPYATSGTFTISRTNGTKTVRLWLRDTLGNVSLPTSRNIDLDFGTPPVISITSPLAGATYTTGDSVPIRWNCSSSNGLATYPISKIEYTTNDGVSFVTPEIAVDLPNNLTSTTGGYDWTLPSGVTTFRLLISCKSAAGVVSTAYSQPLNTGGWSIYLGDPWYGLKNVNATIANVGGTGYRGTRASIVGDESGNVYYQKGHAIMRIDALTGYVQQFAGTLETNGCTVADGRSAIASGYNQLNSPVILGTTLDRTGLLVHSKGCSKIFNIRLSDGVAFEWASIGAATVENFFLGKNRKLLYYQSSNIYSLDLTSAGNTPVKITGMGAGTCVTTVTAGADAVSTPLRSNTAACGGEILLFGNADLSKIWIQLRGDGTMGSVQGYRVDYDNNSQSYKIGLATTGWNYSGVANCTFHEQNEKVYCTNRHSGRTINVFNTQTSAWESSFDIPFEQNDGSGFIAVGTSNSDLLTLYSLNQISSVKLSTGVATVIAGLPFTTMGNGTNQSLVGFDVPIDVKYNATTQALWIRNQNGHMRRVDFSTSPKTTSSIFSSTMISGSTNYAFGINLLGTKATLYWGCSRTGILAADLTSTTLTSAGNVIAGNCDTTSGTQPYPYPDGTAATGGTKPPPGLSTSTTPVYHSNGKVYFTLRSSSNDVLIFSSNLSTINRVAGKIGAGGYVSTDHGQLALGASLTTVHQMQEIASGTNAGDLLIWDSNRLRLITITTEPNAPRIYDILSFGLATGYVNNTTFVDAYYDQSTEISGVLGTGRIFYVTSDRRIRKFVANSSLTAATDTQYPFSGTSFTGTPRITLTPDGLLVLQPNYNRILRVAP